MMRMTRIGPVLLALPLLLAAGPAGAQVVSGTVEARTGGIVPYAFVHVYDRTGEVVGGVSADRSGRFTLRLPAGGRYRLQVTESGYQRYTTSFRVDDDAAFTARVRLEPSIYRDPRTMRDPTGMQGGRSTGQPPRRGGRGMSPRGPGSDN